MAEEPEVINLLNTLYPFAIDDVTTLPYVQVGLISVHQQTKRGPAIHLRLTAFVRNETFSSLNWLFLCFR